ncbi:hypothetical protein H310_10038 [Aphanomyces invadans]|uniref:Uncharacterized protein n=1 Tax=Aphanomyces invadans TaxID=157072 RepID=A0A024TSW2_9STRA|nr:hypothetical protein H310_10038 [Aphanomyces invadans]ETV96721.1 hypothetical protein H310_10038 [Aphanomyces invadans]|eukprot:XP_008874498.1 hypothetical protein H310_10038 [Aphanomyces invadans]
MDAPMSADETTAAYIKAMNRRLKKNMYQRQKQAMYRRQDKMEIAFQRERVVVLEELLAQARKRMRGTMATTAQSTSILSWEDIALALHEGETAAVERNGQLRHHVQRAHVVLEDLKAWVFTRIPTYPISSTWRNVGLVKRPDTRQIGVDWITKQLAYNSTRAFQQYGFPPPDSSETVDDYVYFYDGDGLVAVQRIQYVVNQPFEAFCKLVTSDTFMGDVNLNTGDKPLNPDIHHHIHDSRQGIRLNFVGRATQVDDSHMSYVGQHVNNDELFPTDHLQRHRVMMCDYERVGPSKTKIRSLQLMSALFDKHGVYLPPEAEAKIWGFDLGDGPDYTKPDRFLQCTKKQIADAIARRQLIKKPPPT